MKHVTRVQKDGTPILEPAIGGEVNIDNAIVDRLFDLTEDQRANTERYIVTTDTGSLIDTYIVYRDPHSDGYRLRLTWESSR